MVPKCGEVRVRHWAHKGHRQCDLWWENETAWHRAWKNLFPIDWQEVIHVAGDGELHIADVKTSSGWVLEFQHSYLKPEERRSREAFYPKLVWVVDGARRKRDGAQLLRAWKDGVGVVRRSPLRKPFPNECALVREWGGSGSRTFIDLGEPEALWWLIASASGTAYLHPVARIDFVEWHRSPASERAKRFDAFVNELPKLIDAYESRLARTSTSGALRPRQHRRHFRLQHWTRRVRGDGTDMGCEPES
jgi:hypothetical protein